MNLATIKTEELDGRALDWAVFCAIYPGMQPTITKIAPPPIGNIEWPKAYSLTYEGMYKTVYYWRPSIDWSQCGPLIEKHEIHLAFNPRGRRPDQPWFCHDLSESFWAVGSSPLVAACRAIVALKVGSEVLVPAELVEVKNG